MRMHELQQAHMWLAEHPEEAQRYAGEYIAVVAGRVVAHGHDVKAVYEQAMREGVVPLIAKIRLPRVSVARLP